MFEIRTDLALEAHELASKNKGNTLDGVIFKEENGKYRTTYIEIINSDGARATGKPVGKYITIDAGNVSSMGPDELELLSYAVSNAISSLLPKCSELLAVGLGNTDITADAIGPMSVGHLIVTRHLKSTGNELFADFFDISALAPGVLCQTGIETAEIIKSLAEKIRPSLIIVIDALASRDISRLGSVIQISDVGITPGSGVGNSRPEISLNTLGVPVIAIGVPTVVDAATLAAGVMEECGYIINDKSSFQELEKYKNMFVTPKDCDKIISFMSKAIGYAINMTFHKSLSYEEIVSLGS